MDQLPPEFEKLAVDQKRALVDALFESIRSPIPVQANYDKADYEHDLSIGITWEQARDLMLLSFEEKVAMIDALSESLESEPFVVTPELSAMLQERLANYRAAPSNILTWEQVKANVQNLLKNR
jgi:putative addiction module component (TIGR02574 family)